MAFDRECLTTEEIDRLEELARLARGDIVTMTSLAGSGHPGGSLSSLEMCLVVFSYADLAGPHRDRIVVSHGHTSPGVYAALARLGHLPLDEVVAFFRRARSPYEGHVVRGIPFIDWSTGNLGQGLSAGCGFALAARVKKQDYHVYVLMSDGEQAKGQVAEARRFARKYGLSNITVLVDCNGIQISGATDVVMPVNIAEDYRADGWDVIEVDGHDFDALYRALKKAQGVGKSRLHRGPHGHRQRHPLHGGEGGIPRQAAQRERRWRRPRPSSASRTGPSTTGRNGKGPGSGSRRCSVTGRSSTRASLSLYGRGQDRQQDRLRQGAEGPGREEHPCGQARLRLRLRPGDLRQVGRFRQGLPRATSSRAACRSTTRRPSAGRSRRWASSRFSRTSAPSAWTRRTTSRG